MKLGFIVAASLLLAPSALANAGTPIMWAGFLHLTLGNLAIASVEALLLAKLLGVDYRRAFAFATLANYASCVAGLFFIVKIEDWLGSLIDPRPLHAAPTLIVLAWALTFVLTLLIELPVVAFGVQQKLKSMPFLLAAACANAVTYAVLVLGYASLSTDSLYDKLDVVEVTALADVPDGTVYYIDGQQLMSIQLDGSGKTNLGPLPRIDEQNGSLGLAVEQEDEVARLSLYKQHTTRSLIDDLGPPDGAPTWPSELREGDDEPRRIRHPYYSHNVRYFDLQTDDARDQRVIAHHGFWAELGLSIKTDQDDIGRVVVATPSAYWGTRSVTVLRSGHVLAQVGPQIVLVDPDERKIAWLANGSSPTLYSRPKEQEDTGGD